MQVLAGKHVTNSTCPWSGAPVSEDSLTQYRGRTVGFCNPGCRDKFRNALEFFDAMIDGPAGSQTGTGSKT